MSTLKPALMLQLSPRRSARMIVRFPPLRSVKPAVTDPESPVGMLARALSMLAWRAESANLPTWTIGRAAAPGGERAPPGGTAGAAGGRSPKSVCLGEAVFALEDRAVLELHVHLEAQAKGARTDAAVFQARIEPVVLSQELGTLPRND